MILVCKNLVRNRLRIKFVQLSFLKKFQTRFFKTQVLTACLACKIQVRNRQKSQFHPSGFFKHNFSKCRSIGGMSTFGISLGMFSNHWNYVVFLLYRFEKLIPQIGKMFCQIIKKYPFGEVKRDFVSGLLYPKDSQQQLQLRFICNCCIPV